MNMDSEAINDFNGQVQIKMFFSLEEKKEKGKERETNTCRRFLSEGELYLWIQIRLSSSNLNIEDKD